MSRWNVHAGVLVLALWLAASAAFAADPVPLGLAAPEVPPDNPAAPAKVALGKRLYFDKRLSADDTISCASCHDPARGFADGLPTSVGIRGQRGPRNAPTVLNAALYDTQFWDGRAPSLEEQAKAPLINPVEMGMPSHRAVEEKLRRIPEYKEAFDKVFGGGITIQRVVQAIAAFERTLLSGDSPFDRYFYGGDADALSASARRGFELFRGKGRCANCHDLNPFYALFTDNAFHNIGVGMNKPDPDPGRFRVTGNPADRGAFKTPSLRNVALTAPYMHDGSQKTLEEVVAFYDKGGEKNPYLDGGIVPLGLTEQEKNDLVEFLRSLTGTMPSF